MKKLKVLISLVLITLGLTLTAACATVKPTDTASAEQAIRQSLKSYGEMLMNKDVDGWVGLHTQGVWKMPQDSPPSIGREVLKNNISRGMQIVDIVKFKVDIREVIIFGDYGYALGYYWTQDKLRETGELLPEFEGKFLTVYQKQADGEWLIYRDIFSSNTPVK